MSSISHNKISPFSWLQSPQWASPCQGWCSRRPSQSFAQICWAPADSGGPGCWLSAGCCRPSRLGFAGSPVHSHPKQGCRAWRWGRWRLMLTHHVSGHHALGMYRFALQENQICEESLETKQMCSSRRRGREQSNLLALCLKELLA